MRPLPSAWLPGRQPLSPDQRLNRRGAKRQRFPASRVINSDGARPARGVDAGGALASVDVADCGRSSAGRRRPRSAAGSESGFRAARAADSVPWCRPLGCCGGTGNSRSGPSGSRVQRPHGPWLWPRPRLCLDLWLVRASAVPPLRRSAGRFRIRLHPYRDHSLALLGARLDHPRPPPPQPVPGAADRAGRRRDELRDRDRAVRGAGGDPGAGHHRARLPLQAAGHQRLGGELHRGRRRRARRPVGRGAGAAEGAGRRSRWCRSRT